MLSKRTLLAALSYLVPLSAARAKVARGGYYPTVPEFEQQFSLYPGQPFPKQALVNGRVFEAIYEGANYAGNGAYDVRVRVRSVG